MYECCNRTELVAKIRATYGVIPAPDVTEEVLIAVLNGQHILTESEISGTTKTRRRLEKWLNENWAWAQGQLPCSGPGRGKCSTYPCPEGQHVDCYLSVEKKIV